MKYLTLIIFGIATAACASDYDNSPKVNTLVTNRGVVTDVIPPNCPNWTKQGWHSNYDNTDSSNFRCATNKNFGAMIDDPNDMISGKSTDKYQGQRTSNSVTNYRLGGVSQ